MGVELCGAASVEADLCAGLCSFPPPQPAISVAPTRIVIWSDNHRFGPNRVIILVNPQIVDDAFWDPTNGGCHDHRNGVAAIGLFALRHYPRRVRQLRPIPATLLSMSSPYLGAPG